MGREERVWSERGEKRAAAVAALLLAFAPLAKSQSDETEVRSFSLPDTRAAQGLVAAALDHLAAERMQDASDTAAFSAAVIHARGMNMLALLNMIMAALAIVAEHGAGVSPSHRQLRVLALLDEMADHR